MKKILLAIALITTITSIDVIHDETTKDNVVHADKKSEKKKEKKNNKKSKKKKEFSKKDTDKFIEYAEPILQEAMSETGITISMRNIGGIIAVAVDDDIKYQDTATIQQVADSTLEAVRVQIKNYTSENKLKVPGNKYEFPGVRLESADGTVIAKENNKRVMQIEKEFLGR